MDDFLLEEKAKTGAEKPGFRIPCDLSPAIP
jgi:hypothetical protein